DHRHSARFPRASPPGGPDLLDPSLDPVELLQAQDRELTDPGRLDPQAVEQAAEIVRADLELPAGRVQTDGVERSRHGSIRRMCVGPAPRRAYRKVYPKPAR